MNENQINNNPVQPEVLNNVNPPMNDYTQAQPVNNMETESLEVDNGFQYEEEPRKLNAKWIAIILLLLLLLGIGGFFGYKMYKDKKYDDWLNKIREAAKNHVDFDQTVRDKILEEDGGKVVLRDIIDSGYLVRNDLINPKTGKKIDACNFVKAEVSDSMEIRYTEVTLNNKVCPDGDKSAMETGKPIITLKGQASVSIKQNTTYIDAGATAEDVDGNDISPLIVVTNNVNTKVVGEYTVVYNVTNAKGQKATSVTRKVIVTGTTGGTTGGGTGGDRTNPVITASSIPTTLMIGEKTNFTLTFTDNSALKSITYCTPNCTTQNVSGRSTSRNLTFDADSAGNKTISASVVDASGNRGYFSRTISVTNRPDKEKPTVTLVSAPTTVIQGQDINIRVKMEDNVAIARYTICVGGYCTSANDGSHSEIIKSYTVNTNIVDDYPVTVTVVDTSGNEVVRQLLTTVKVNLLTPLSNPVVTLISKPDVLVAGQTAEFKFNFKDPNGMVNYNVCLNEKIASNPLNYCSSRISISPWANDVDKTHNLTLPNKAGTYTLTVGARDQSSLSNSNWGTINAYLGDVVISGQI